MFAGNVLLDLTVGPADKIGQIFNGIVERTKGAFIELFVLGITEDKTIETAPIVVKIFDKIIESDRARYGKIVVEGNLAKQN